MNSIMFLQIIKKNKANIIFIGIILSITYLLYYYRNVGIHDVGAYLHSGEVLIDRKNPYELGLSKWGTVGPIILYLFSKIIPNSLSGTIFQLINLFGVFLFFRIFSNSKKSINTQLIFLLVLWISPVREMLAVNQITGIILGCLSLGQYFILASKDNNKFVYKFLISPMCFAIAIDLKPHITIYIFIILIIATRNFKLLFNTALIFVFMHLIIDFYVGIFLERDWVHAVLKVGSSASDNKLRDSVSFWPLLNHYINFPKAFYLVSFILIIALLLYAIYLGYKMKTDAALYIGLIIPSLSIYYHYYDSIPLCILALNWAITERKYIYSALLLSFFLIPKEYLSLRNTFLVLLFEIVLMIIFTNMGYIADIFLVRNLIYGIGFTYLIHLINTLLNLNPFILQSIVVSETLFLTYYLLFQNGKNAKIFNPILF